MQSRMKLFAITASTALLACAPAVWAQGVGGPGALHYGSSGGGPGPGELLGTPGQGLALQPGQAQVMFRASQLIGLEASSPQGQVLGKVAEIVFHPQIGIFGVIDMPNGRIVPVPWALLSAVTAHGLVFNTTAQAMNAAPSITGGEWADFNSPAFTHTILAYYGVGGQGAQHVAYGPAGWGGYPGEGAALGRGFGNTGGMGGAGYNTGGGYGAGGGNFGGGYGGGAGNAGGGYGGGAGNAGGGFNQGQGGYGAPAGATGGFGGGAGGPGTTEGAGRGAGAR